MTTFTLPNTVRTPQRNDGFTLIEIVMVLVLLGFIASIAASKYFDMQEKAEAQTCAANRDVLSANLRAAWAETVIAGQTPVLSSLYDALTDKPVCPTSGDDYKLVTADGDIHNFTIECATHGGTTSANAAAPTEKQMADIMSAFADPANRGSNTALDSGAVDLRKDNPWIDTASLRVYDALKAQGIDLQALGAQSWQYQQPNNGTKILYFTPQNIQGLNKNTVIPVVKYDKNTETYTICNATIGEKSLDRVNPDSHVNTHFVYNALTSFSAGTDSTVYTTAQDALNALQALQAQH